MKNLSVILVCLMTSFSAVAAEERYVIDPAYTVPMFEIYSQFSLSAQHGHFKKVSGDIRLNREKGSGSIDLKIDANSLDMGNDKWSDVIKTEMFFDTKKYPTITFASNDLIFKNGLPISANGNLSLHGVTRPVSLIIDKFVCNGESSGKNFKCGAQVSMIIKRSDFGMSAVKLVYANDEVRLSSPVEAFKK